MNRERWNQDYPQMPESFHDTVLKEVLRHTQVSIPKKKHRSPKTYLLTGIAAVFVLGATAIGVEPVHKFVFQEWLGLSDREGIGEAILPSPSLSIAVQSPGEKPDYMDDAQWESYPDLPAQWTETPVLSIQELLFDGQKLVIYGAVPSGYQAEVTTLSINGKEYGPAENQTAGAADEHGASAHIITLNFQEPLSAPFRVEMPVRIYGKQGRTHIRYKNQDLSFTVDTPSEAISLPDQSFSLKECTVEVTNLSLSLTTLTGTLSISMDDAQKEAYQNSSQKILPNTAVIRGENQEIWEGQNPSVPDSRISYTESEIPLAFSFHVRVPEDGQSSVMLNLVTPREISPDGKIDLYSEANLYGDPMKLSLIPN